MCRNDRRESCFYNNLPYYLGGAEVLGTSFLGVGGRASCLLSMCSTTQAPTLPDLSCAGYFQGRISWISMGWPRTAILLISVSQVARITSMSHGCLALGTSYLRLHHPCTGFFDPLLVFLRKNTSDWLKSTQHPRKLCKQKSETVRQEQLGKLATPYSQVKKSKLQNTVPSKIPFW
jgi:hypothetical protein